ncbi:hypothetical protein PCK1_001384 [Pneumocystis canis]|nr:hypothetical protein PCK1_001384 [Pneumocystis canis]
MACKERSDVLFMLMRKKGLKISFFFSNHSSLARRGREAVRRKDGIRFEMMNMKGFRCLRKGYLNSKRRWVSTIQEWQGLKDKTLPVGKVSSFRGAFIGFLMGTSFTSAIGYYYLLNEYQHASNTLFLSIEELQRTTESMMNRMKEVEAMQQTMAQWEKKGVTKNEMETVRLETKKMFENLNLAYLEANERFSELEMDVAKLSRQARVTV